MRGAQAHLEAFIRTIVITSIMSRVSNGPGTIKSTVKQWREVLKDRFGLELDPQQFNRLKTLLMRKAPRPGKPAKEARGFEVLREVKEGWYCNTNDGFKRYPSEFEASEWLEGVLALGHETLDEPLPCPVPPLAIEDPVEDGGWDVDETTKQEAAEMTEDVTNMGVTDMNVRQSLRLVRQDSDVRRFQADPKSAPILETLQMLMDSGKITLSELQKFVDSASDAKRGFATK
jgi:hypothetical protein